MDQVASHIGEKIKKLRLSKLMTQQELAGAQITRNMLSAIEHGTALPSLPTALYLAERLGVPVGYLLADEHDESAYRKMLHMANIRTAFAQKDFMGCLALLNSFFGETRDDEISLIRAECELGLGRSALSGGRLRLAAAALDRALLAAEQTVFDTSHMRACIAVYFRYFGEISSSLVSDVLDAEEVERARVLGDPLAEYVLALEALEQGQSQLAREYIERYPDTLYRERIATRLLMNQGEYIAAQQALEALLARDELTFGVLLFEVCGDLEICYRKNEDYKRAYEFSGSRLGLLERLLEEV